MPTTNQQSTYRRITGTDTIPSSANSSLTGGTVTTDTTNSDHLVYSGTADLSTIFNRVLFGYEGIAWIYIPSVSPYLAKVLDIQNTGTNTWVIMLDRPFSGVSGATAYSVVADLKKFSISNDGGAAGLVNGVSLADGETINDKILYNYKTNCLDAIAADGTGTSLLVQESR